MARDNQNFVVGSGRLYFARQRPDGSFEGERYLGDTTQFTISISTEKLAKYSSDCGARTKVRDIVVQTDRTVSITCEDISWENVALALQGEVKNRSQAATPVVDEEILDVQTDRFYYVGVTDSNPLGVGECSVITVKNGIDTMVAGEDYEVSLKHGRIYVIPGGDIGDGDDLEVSYTPVANSYTSIEAGAITSQKGRLRHEACNLEGEERDTLIPLIDLSPSGDYAPKSNGEWMTLDFTGEILTYKNLPAVIINGVAVA